MTRDCCEPVDPSHGYDLAVLGGGSAAFAAALRAVELGARVLLVNEGTIGGTCVNVGCVPSKTLIRAAENAHWNRLSRFRGVKPDGGHVDFAELVREKDELVGSLRRAKYVDVAAAHDPIDVVEGRARLVDSHTVDVAGVHYRAEKLVIATGSRPALPAIPGLEESDLWDSTRALDARALPTQLIVLGGRYIALELGQMFARLGSQVTLVQRSPQILPDEDPDVADALTDHLREEGLDIRTGCPVERVRRDGQRRSVELHCEGQTIEISADSVLAALGRAPNTAGLPGVELNPDGFVHVGEDLQTSLPGVYAAGDVIGDPMYVYTAAYEGALAAENALRGTATSRDYSALPWVIFTDPQVAGVGLNEREAQTAGLDVEVSVVPLSSVPRALAARDTRGFVKLLRARGTDRLIGARILAPEGGEQIMQASLMLRFGLPISEIARAFHPYLTQSEAIKLALLGFEKDVATLSCCAT